MQAKKDRQASGKVSNGDIRDQKGEKVINAIRENGRKAGIEFPVNPHLMNMKQNEDFNEGVEIVKSLNIVDKGSNGNLTENKGNFTQNDPTNMPRKPFGNVENTRNNSSGMNPTNPEDKGVEGPDARRDFFFDNFIKRVNLPEIKKEMKVEADNEEDEVV